MALPNVHFYCQCNRNGKKHHRLDSNWSNNTEEKSEGPVITIQHMYNNPLSPILQFTIMNRHPHENTKFSTRNAKFCSHLKYFVPLSQLY